MRILHVNKFVHRRGGAEAYLLDLADLQRRDGHEVQVWGMAHPDDPPGLPLADTFASFVALDPAPRGPAGVRAAARMVWSPGSAARLAEAVRRFRPEAVHFHNVYHQLSPSVLSPSVRGGVPAVLTLHDYKLACPSYQMLDHGRPCRACVDGGVLQAARRRCKGGSLPASALLSVESGVHRLTGAWRRVDALVSPSRFLAGVVRDAGVDHGRLHVVPHFVDPPASAAPREPAPGRFAVAGRLSAEKGVDTAVRAVGLVPGAVLDVAGDGPEREALERLAGEVAPGRVRFLGRLTRDGVADLLRGSVATLVPSRWYENQPMTVLESYALGVPVVATRMGGLPELVDDGVDGLLVAPDDPAALAAALERLIADPGRVTDMGRTGAARVQEEFSARRHLDSLSELYQGVGRG